MLYRTFVRTSAAAAVLFAAPLAAPLAAQVETITSTPSALGIDTAGFDPNVRAQDDFYRFANGRWLAEIEIPEDRTSIGTFSILAQRSERALRSILEDAVLGKVADPDAERLADLFRSFLDETRVDSLGTEPVREELSRFSRAATHAEVLSEFARLSRIGITGPFSFSVGPDPMDSEWNVLSLSQSGLGIGDRDLYFQEGERFDEIRDAYLQYTKELLRLAGHVDPAAAARELLALETAIAGHHWTRTQNRDRRATYNRMTVRELESSAPSVDWTRFFEEAGAGAPDELVVRQPDYLVALDSIWSAAPVEVWRDYLTVRFLDEAAPYLSGEFVDARFGFRGRTLQGLEEQSPRWRRGLNLVESSMGEALGRIYVGRHFEPAARERMEFLVGNLLEAFRIGIDELGWMSPATRAEAHQKLAAMNVKIGYPDEWRDYSSLRIDGDDLIGNWRRASEFQRQRVLDRLGRPVDRSEWFMTPQTVNAYYSAAQNEIVFPAAILQPPFFDLAADDAVNYGAIGAVIGHEISHGFDDQGRRSDGEGNLRDWWTVEDEEAFEERASALAAQFSGFSPLEGLSLNGRLSLGENIGDLSGLAVAHRAYRLSLAGCEAPVIEGFTGDQRFFLGWAQIWRISYREAALRQLVMTGPHSPGEYRVNGIVRNLPAFYEAFAVQEGDGMFIAPDERVRIW
jgi:putative endopeptidase